METRGKFRIVATVCALAACWTAGATAKVIYVGDDATGANDGSSWANAFLDLQDALAVSQVGDEVRVAQGLYRPDRNARVLTAHGSRVEISPSGLRNAAFRLRNGVSIVGGFAGLSATDPNDRDVQRYETILSGDIYGNDRDSWGLDHPMSQALREDNSEYVVESPNTDATAVLDGFTIQSAALCGLYNRNGSPHVVHCTFRYNSSPMYSGGAVRCDGGQPSFSSCLFHGNAAMVAGGAIYASGARLTLSDCRFVNNWAVTLGGAICSVNSDCTFTGCMFLENAGLQGGAIYHQQGMLTLTDCGFEGNMAKEQGGAVNLIQQKAVSMTGCTYRGNWTPHLGGAVANEGLSLLLERCTFTGNRAKLGGAIHTHGSSPLSAHPQAAGTVMAHCIFTGNDASNAGGALWGYRAEFTISACTFADNWARAAATMGRSAGQGQETILRVGMENSIVWDGNNSLLLAQLPTQPADPSTEAGVDIVIRYSDVQGGWPGEGNIDTDPRFANPGHWVDASDPAVNVKPDHPRAIWVEGDYHLKAQAGRRDPVSEDWVQDDVTSPCIDAGDPKSPAGDEPQPNGGRINMGAYGGTPEASKSPVR
jgi:predicted outer membrane repeat protein